MQDASATGASTNQTLPEHQWADSHPAASPTAVPPRQQRDTRQMDRVTTAFVSVAVARLERDHVALLAAICELESAGSGPASTAAGPSPAISNMILMELLRDDLRQTQRALRLAADGALGYCDMCHNPLSTAILLTRPSMTRCSSCTGVVERSAQVH